VLMKLARCITLLLFCAGLGFAGEVIDSLVIDGKTYDGVKWGPVNQGKVVIFHYRGVATVPLDKLPPQYQAQFGYHPATNAAATTTNGLTAAVSPAPPNPQEQLDALHGQPVVPMENSDWESYIKDRATKVLLDGRLVERAKLIELTGFLVAGPFRVSDDASSDHPWILNLAERRNDLPSTSHQFELRPGLWQPNGEMVVLLNYSVPAEEGALIRVYASETRQLNGRRAYTVAKEPTFEEWQRLHAQ
jgi:hypothetical protein